MTDLTGRTILVTGATSGIGLAASERLAGMGAELILVGRDPGRLEAAAAAVRSRSRTAPQAVPTRSPAAPPGSDLARVSTLRHDLSSLSEVRALAAEVRERWPRLHVLVNDAGGANGARELTADGLERTFAVNHLAPYLLTRLLLDRLIESRPARIVTVSSVAHRRARLDFADLQLARGYSVMRAYGASKLANVLFTRELSRRLAGTGVTASCLHPGVVATRIWSRAPGWTRPFFALATAFMLTPEQGADGVVFLAASPEAERLSGAYLEKGRVVEPAPQARDDDAARRLWDESARLVGLDP